jgi:hypothetical protein
VDPFDLLYAAYLCPLPFAIKGPLLFDTPFPTGDCNLKGMNPYEKLGTKS